MISYRNYMSTGTQMPFTLTGYKQLLLHELECKFESN